MKLITYDQGNAPRAGLWSSGMIADLEKAARAVHKAKLPASVRALLESGPAGMAAARAVAAKVEKLAAQVEAGKTRRPAWLIRDEDAHLGPPVPDPQKIICLGLNYVDHWKEQERRDGRPVAPPENPLLFAKFPSSLIGPNDAIKIPANVTQKVDFEVELAVVIGAPAKKIGVRAAMDAVAGYMVMNDVSARDCQFSDRQWVRAKSFDTFAPCGPWLVTADDIPNPHRLGLWTILNGETMQRGNTRDMIHKLPRIIAYINQAISLRPGDIISTGTPAGVGIFRDPPIVMKPGDVLETGIDHIGTLCNHVERA